MARRSVTEEPSPYPKEMVRVIRTPSGEYSTEVRMVADADAEAAAIDEGFAVAAEVAPPPEPVEYPKWLYHQEQPAVIVQTEQEAKALGEGWVDTPADFPEPGPLREKRA